MTAAFDGKTSTKWFAATASATAWIGYDFGAGATHVVSSYKITSANDYPEETLSAWLFQARTTDDWTTLD